MEGKDIDSKLSNWTKDTEAMMKNMNDFADSLMGDLSEEERKQVEAEVKKQDMAPLQMELKKQMDELNKTLENIK